MDEILTQISKALAQRGISDRAASLRVSSNPSLIRDMRRGHAPSVNRVKELSNVLGLEFYIGPPREVDTEAVAPAVSDEVARVLRDGITTLRELVISRLPPPLADEAALTPANDPGGSPAARPVGVIEADAAAGGGTLIENAPSKGQVWFRRDWLDGHGLDASACAVIGVAGESMEPTLMHGARILIDRSRTEPRGGDIFVLRATDGLIVKRLAASRMSGWKLVSDHPDWEMVSFPDDAEIIGRVVWTARTLIREDR